MNANGLITRPKLLAAYLRICGRRNRGNDQAEAFLRMIAKNAAYRGISFDENAERLGY